MSQRRKQTPHMASLAFAVLCFIKLTEATSSSTSGLLPSDATFDLKRLSALPPPPPPALGDSQAQLQQSQPIDQVTAAASTASHESLLNVGGEVNPLLQMLAASSSPMPLGRRRLDSDDAPAMPQLNYNNQLLAANLPETLMAAASRAGRSKNPYGSIVDNGSPGSGLGQIPSGALAAQMANNDYNRLALASALEYQRALASRQTRKLAGGRQQQQQQQQVQVQVQVQREGRLRQQESRRRSQASRGGVNRRALAQAAERDAGDQTEYDELSSRSGGGDDVDGEESSSAAAAGDEDEDGNEDDSGEAKRSASRRQSDGFGDQTDEELNADDNEDEGARDERRSGSPRAGRKQVAASRQQLVSRRQASGQAGPLGRAPKSSGASSRGRVQTGQDADEVEEEGGESSNARQLRTTAAAAVTRGGQLTPRQAHEQQQMFESIQRQMMTAAAAAAASSTTDDLSSASHVLNTKTDLQAAAGHHHGHHGHYYQYVEVPKKKAWKFGFKRGNHKHEIEKHEKGHKHKFHTEFKWHAKEKCKKKSKCKSVGKMVWDYKHAKKHHH